MIIEPKVREYICTTAHPQGCGESVRRQAAYAASKGEITGAKKALIIGCSTGYGLASRISALVNCKAATLGIMFERPANEKRTATPGWYNTAEFEKLSGEQGIYARTLNGDAFSREMKEQAIEAIREDLGEVDLVVYSLAAPRRTDENGVTWNSCLKTTAAPFTEKSLDLRTNKIVEKTIQPATEEEVQGTVKVMGGEDWADWIDALSAAGVLKKDAVTVAYSYIGPELTYPIYYHGTIGTAKQHLHQTANEINQAHPDIKAYISVNKGLVTQASSAIPIVPLYFGILYKVMKKKGLHEGCIEQMTRLFTEKLYGKDVPETDENGFIRMDDYELLPEIQEEVNQDWKAVTTENLEESCDLDGYWEDFYHMFGFHYGNIDYAKDTDPVIPIPSLE
ncbi:MAG: trans-2-enoyl-CoA reductase family protein [Eubacteriales bacterium]|nr:trans-2-enoyl-CoA reductase family protein [Eubacteriales bacterium]